MKLACIMKLFRLHWPPEFPYLPGMCPNSWVQRISRGSLGFLLYWPLLWISTWSFQKFLKKYTALCEAQLDDREDIILQGPGSVVSSPDPLSLVLKPHTADLRWPTPGLADPHGKTILFQAISVNGDSLPSRHCRLCPLEAESTPGRTPGYVEGC